MKGNIKKFYTVDDLKNVLYTYPCSTETGYISYTKRNLTNIIKKDFNGEKRLLKQKIWNNEAPAVYGLDDTTPYSEEAKEFAKSQKTHGGGKNLIIMNEAYFSNARYMIEDRYWDLQQDTFKRDTRKNMHDAVSRPVKTGNETELRNAVEESLNKFLSKMNKEIASMNDFLKSKYSQFFSYRDFYERTYVQRLIEKPTELLDMLDNQIKIMKDGFKSLSVNYEKQEKFIDSIISLLSEKNYSDEEKINTIVDRIYGKESSLIEQLREIHDEFEKIKIKTYQLEDAIRAETEKRIKAGEGICSGSLIIDMAKNSGLINTSFNLSDK